jgi:hypothetical protein
MDVLLAELVLAFLWIWALTSLGAERRGDAEVNAAGATARGSAVAPATSPRPAATAVTAAGGSARSAAPAGVTSPPSPRRTPSGRPG